jgi:membrane-associated protein
MSRFLDQLVNQNGAIVYLVVSLVVFAEDALFFGFVLPGETAAILGGVAAARGSISVVLMCVVVVAAAVLGDTVGYEIGSRYGVRLLSLPVLRRRQDRVDKARRLLARWGGPAVFIGRFLAFLRAIMPFLAGVSHMRYPRFLVFNAAGGLTWGIGSVLLGYLAGNSYTAVERTFGKVAAIAVAALVVALLIVWTVRRHVGARRRDSAEDSDSSDATSDNTGDGNGGKDNRGNDNAGTDNAGNDNAGDDSTADGKDAEEDP